MADEDQSTEKLLETFKALDDLGKAPDELVGRIVINLSGVEET